MKYVIFAAGVLLHLSYSQVVKLKCNRSLLWCQYPLYFYHDVHCGLYTFSQIRSTSHWCTLDVPAVLTKCKQCVCLRWHHGAHSLGPPHHITFYLHTQSWEESSTHASLRLGNIYSVAIKKIFAHKHNAFKLDDREMRGGLRAGVYVCIWVLIYLLSFIWLMRLWPWKTLKDKVSLNLWAVYEEMH